MLFSHSVVSDFSWPHGLQHTRLPCPSPSPRACSNSCPLSQWCHPTVSSFVISFSSCLQSYSASGSFPVIQLFTLVGQYWNFSFSFSPSNEYSGLISFKIGWFDLPAVQRTLKSILQHYSSKNRSLHLWRELDHKEGWALKNWCFWTVVLEKTLESPLDSEEIKPLNPKGNQPWIFIGRTDAEVEAPIVWPPDAESTHWKRPWCWERLRAGGEEEGRECDG